MWPLCSQQSTSATIALGRGVPWNLYVPCLTNCVPILLETWVLAVLGISWVEQNDCLALCIWLPAAQACSPGYPWHYAHDMWGPLCHWCQEIGWCTCMLVMVIGTVGWHRHLTMAECVKFAVPSCLSTNMTYPHCDRFCAWGCHTDLFYVVPGSRNLSKYFAVVSVGYTNWRDGEIWWFQYVCGFADYFWMGLKFSAV